MFFCLLDIEIYVFLSIDGILTYSNKKFLIIELILYIYIYIDIFHSKAKVWNSVQIHNVLNRLLQCCKLIYDNNVIMWIVRF